MKNFSIILSSVAVVLATVSLVVSLKKPCSANGADANTEFTSKVAQALNEQPKMVVEAIQNYQIQQQELARKAAEEALSKFADEINSTNNLPFVGPEDAKVTVVEFFDFSCGYCKILAKEFTKLMADNTDVKFVFKPLSFVDPRASYYQAQAAIAANNQGKFVEFYNAIMTKEGRMNKESVDAVAEEIGLDMDKYKADVEAKATNETLSEVSGLAQKVQIHGVPAVIVNGKHVQTLSAVDLQQAIDEAK